MKVDQIQVPEQWFQILKASFHLDQKMRNRRMGNYSL